MSTKKSDEGHTQYVVGIDLGTTHCAMGSASLEHPTVRLIDIPQLVAPGETAKQALLPSFTYLPAPGELGSDGDEPIVGELARRLGAKSPNRLIASAKSWVCHGGVNRRAPILPWSAPDSEAHLSPYSAQVGYLAHIRKIWEERHPGLILAEQDVVVTVPASFDESARELTSDAAKEAGLGEDVRLLEEPQAAFYDFLGSGSHNLEQHPDARLILVVDVGGGTTDLTLLRVNPQPDVTHPQVERIAVGGHLMLGGDNMDAALALHALSEAEMPRPDDATVWSSLVQSARQAKEKLLGEDAPAKVTITVQGRGSKLFGNTKTLTLEREQVSQVMLDGFVPFTEPTDTANRGARAGLTTLGLPYTSDVAIPRHICAFLRKHQQAALDAGSKVVDGLPQPDLLLLNGGVFKAPSLIQRLCEVLAKWYDDKPIPLLDYSSLETAVASGAVRSGLARRGVGERIGGGTARAYYIGIQSTDGSAQGLCIAPKGMEEDTSLDIPERTFDLTLNQPVSFKLFEYTGDRVDSVGDLVTFDNDEHGLEPLPALETMLRDRGRSPEDGDRSSTGVTLKATQTETGALELFLVTVSLPPKRWRLNFALQAPVVAANKAAADARKNEPLPPETQQACDVLTTSFADKDPTSAKGVRSSIEKLLGPRGKWSATQCRALWEACMQVPVAHRGNSDIHELNWMRICGWGLRPGWGADDEETRLDQMWQVWELGLQTPTKANWAQWWIMWRMVAGGLDLDRQQKVFDFIAPWLWRQGNKLPPGPSVHGPVEMMQLLAALEQLSPKAKEDCGELFFERSKKLRSYWPVARVGARILMQTGLDPADHLVPSDVATRWLERLLALDWKTAEGSAFASASLARKSDQPWSVDPELQKQVMSRLADIDAPNTWIDIVARGGSLSDKDTKHLFGESLPTGLRLQ